MDASASALPLLVVGGNLPNRDCCGFFFFFFGEVR